MNKNKNTKKFLGLVGMSILCACTSSSLENSIGSYFPHNAKTVLCYDKRDDRKKVNCGLINFLSPKMGVFVTTSGTPSIMVMQML